MRPLTLRTASDLGEPSPIQPAARVGLVLSVVAAAATLVAVRIVVSRSQPAISPELIAVDDAMRTQAVHTLAGTGIAIGFIGTAACLLEMGGSSSVEWLRYLGVIGGICALAMVPVAWGFRGADWQVAAFDAAVIVTVDPRSPVPPFEQLRISIRQLVATGALPLGTRLPTVRQLASDLGLAPGTVGRAFRGPEAEGLIETRGRHGTRVKRAPRLPKGAERDKCIRRGCGHICRGGRGAGN